MHALTVDYILSLSTGCVGIRNSMERPTRRPQGASRFGTESILTDGGYTDYFLRVSNLRWPPKDLGPQQRARSNSLFCRCLQILLKNINENYINYVNKQIKHIFYQIFLKKVWDTYILWGTFFLINNKIHLFFILLFFWFSSCLTVKCNESWI